MSTVYKGSCLCQKVSFEVRGRLSGVSFCHCSKCRKVSGAGSGAVAVTGAENLVLLKGDQFINRFEFATGWSSTFCSCCGSPLPQQPSQGKLWFVPVGCLDDDPGPDVMWHIHVGSKTSWDHSGGDPKIFEASYE